MTRMKLRTVTTSRYSRSNISRPKHKAVTQETTPSPGQNPGYTCPPCNSTVSAGIECTHCKAWLHPACAKLTPQEFKQYRADPTKPWLCQQCTRNPVLQTVAALIKHHEAQAKKYESELGFLRTQAKKFEHVIESLQRELNRTSSTKAPDTLSTPATRTAKRPRPSDSPPTPAPRSNSPTLQPTPNPVATAWCPAQGANQHRSGPKPTTQAHPNKQGDAPKTLVPTLAHTRSSVAPTVICSQIPEPTGPTLAARKKEEEAAWEAVCQILKVQAIPTELARLSRKRDSPLTGQPRLLKVTFQTMREAEDVLLAASSLVSKSKTRIYPDLPKQQRAKLSGDREIQASEKAKRVLLIHGIPQLKEVDDAETYLHDCQEWRYIQKTLLLTTLLTTDVYRIKTSDNYRGSGPRILKITLLSPTMVDEALQAWRTHRRCLPPDVRMYSTTKRSPEPLTTQQPTPSHPPIPLMPDQNTITTQPNSPICQLVPKNGQLPAQLGLAP